jgi:hypothetical protein
LSGVFVRFRAPSGKNIESQLLFKSFIDKSEPNEGVIIIFLILNDEKTPVSIIVIN